MGQCGNQVGQQFWHQLCKEHGIKQDGTSDVTEKREDETKIFFNNNGDRYTPRAILLDLEPGVISDVKNQTDNLFNERNIHIPKDGSGAGNIWSKGYDYGNEHAEEYLEMIDREMDSCDNLEAFQLFHSVAGGTGSGLGSHLLELLSDRYNKKLTTTYSVFPESVASSDVVIQPYNTVLTLRRLIESSDANIVFENSALRSNAVRVFQEVGQNDEVNKNQLISTVISATTNTLRYPGYMYNSLTSIISTLVPTPDLHFIIPSYSPYTSDFVENAKSFRKSTGYDVILELLDKKIKMIDVDDKHNSYISIFDILQGDLEKTDVQKAIIKAQQRAKFVPWSSSSVHIAYGKKSQHLVTPNSNHVSGLMLSNSSSIITLLDKTCKQYDKIMRRNAFLGGYKDGKLFQNGLEEFEESREAVQSVINEYKAAELVSYLDDDEDEDVEL